MHLRHDVLAVDIDPLAPRRAQRDVQDGPVLGDVDLLAGEHRVAALRDAALLRKLEQQPQRLAGDPVLRVVQEDALGLEHEGLAAFRIRREQIAEMRLAERVGVLLERLPRRSLAKG